MSPTDGRPRRRVVYTALFGRYEKLNDHGRDEADVDYICFTEDPETVSDCWEVRVVEPRFPMDSVRSARYVKMLGMDLLADYDESLWIDNTVRLERDAGELLDAWLATSDIAMPRHSYRQSVVAEFDVVATRGYDDPARVYEQLIHYSALYPDTVKQVPYWTALIARRHTTQVRTMMRLWSDHVLRYSRRDQLSVNVAAELTETPVTGIVLDNWHSEWHEWPVITERRWEVTQDRMANALRTPTAELGRQQNRVHELEQSLARLTQDWSEMESRVARATAIEHSRTWRLTAPLRRIGRALRRG